MSCFHGEYQGFNFRHIIFEVFTSQWRCRESSVKFISLEFTGEICAVDINLGVVGILVEFRAMRADEITKYATDVEKRNCLRSEPWEFCTLDVRNIRFNQQRQRRNYL